MQSVLVTGLLATAAAASLYNESNVNHTCALTDSSSIRSCTSAANPLTVDSCCVETFGGLFLSTQFWSTYTGLESEGQLLPPNSWTLHGLWPDFCNGSYTQYCDLTRQYDPAPSPNTTNGLPNGMFPRWTKDWKEKEKAYSLNHAGTFVAPYTGPSIDKLIEPFSRYDLLEWMNKYWINQGAPNSAFWGHEFSKHATCYSTFDVPCYGPEYVEHQEIVDFFQTAIMYYRRLPTWQFLANAGITPSNSTTYSLSSFQSALTAGYGALPFIGCTGPRYNTTAAGANSTDNGRTQINEVWYYFNAFGKPQNGIWLPRNTTSFSTTCAKAPGALHYPLPANGSTW